jgi:hypothetical protein
MQGRRIVKSRIRIDELCNKKSKEIQNSQSHDQQHRKPYEMTYHYSQKHRLTDRIPSQPILSHSIPYHRFTISFHHRSTVSFHDHQIKKHAL